jgi:hypothetical protein
LTPKRYLRKIKQRDLQAFAVYHVFGASVNLPARKNHRHNEKRRSTKRRIETRFFVLRRFGREKISTAREF